MANILFLDWLFTNLIKRRFYAAKLFLPCLNELLDIAVALDEWLFLLVEEFKVSSA